MESQYETNLRSVFSDAQSKSKSLESFVSSSDALYQKNLRSAIACFEQCRQTASHISLFSPNETIDDVPSGDLPYFQIDFYLGDLSLKEIASDRKRTLRRAQDALERYLHLLDTYRMLSKRDASLFEQYSEEKDNFSLIESNDAAMRRDTKIKRYRDEKELRRKLEHLDQNPKALEQDDTALRSLYQAQIDLSTHQAFQHLDMIGQELKILAMKPPTPPPGAEHREQDYRERQGLGREEYSDRLDPSLSDLYRNGKAGPILNKDGKPLQPFTLVDSRQRLHNGVFQPDHRLPTMTINEYLDEERKRGGVIDGGGEQSIHSAPVDEDSMARADAETMKAREWDEFVEANPKGSGNTINRG